ncbi:MAG: NUDIX domain-containing protein [Myxococcota bacterium]
MPISAYLARVRRKVGHDELLAPAITAIVIDDRGWVLLHRSSDDGAWHTIGGVTDPGEEPADTVVREVREETGLEVVPERLVGVWSTPPLVYANGDRMVYVGMVFACRVVGGTLAIGDDESLEVAFFPPDGLPPLPDHQRDAIDRTLRGERGAFSPPSGRTTPG